MNGKEYFDAVAKDWDKMRQDFFPDSVRDAAFERADIKPGQVAADIGSGTGFITEGLIRRGVEVIAVDQSKEMIELMKKKFGTHTNVTYVTGESAAIPIANDSVDAVFANMYLHHVESPRDAIKEMTRILKSGGVIVITDLDKHDFDFLVTEQSDRWMGFERGEVISWFEDAGLQNVMVDCVGNNCCAKSSTTSRTAEISIFVASGRKNTVTFV